MSRIKGKDTSLEKKLRKVLFTQGIKYRLNYPLFGKPDITIPSKKIAIFVNGCFWHQHENCQLSCMPKTNVDFWKTKLLKNVERDKEVKLKLESDSWKVIKVWECKIENDFERISKLLIKTINNYAKSQT